jgi:hypothetical protein
VQLLVFTALGAAAAVVSYAFGQGGPIAGMLFLTFLFIGALLRVAKPLLDLLKPSGQRRF